MEEALEKMHGHSLKIQGAGRTDSGVHATGQVANFFSDLDSIPAAKYRDALNSHLPHDIRILESREVEATFGSKRSARIRTYSYFLYVDPVVFPHYRRYCWKISRKPDIENINRMAAKLLGEHDFSTFTAAGDSSKSKVRKIYSACFYPGVPFLVFRVSAGSFLWKMVRSILGTILELEQNGLGPQDMEKKLKSKDRSLVGATAPARGLFLERIFYDDEDAFPG